MEFFTQANDSLNISDCMANNCPSGNTWNEITKLLAISIIKY